MSADSPGPAVAGPPWNRPRPTPRPPITRELIVDAALRVLDAESLETVSMRRVAQELNTGPASLYAHVANKKELLDLMFDRVVGGVGLPGPPEPQRWREQVHALAGSMHATLSRHSDIARVALAHPPTGPNALLVAECLLGILLAGGVPARPAAWAVDRLALYICAAAYVDGSSAGSAPTPPAFRARTSLSPSPTSPTRRPGAPDRFLFGLDLLLDGLAAQVPAPPSRHAAR